MEQSDLSNGHPYRGNINTTYYTLCVKLAKTLLLKNQEGDKENALQLWSAAGSALSNGTDLTRVVLLMMSPCSGEMTRAFAETIMDAVLKGKEFNDSLEQTVRLIYEIAKTWSFGHTYLERGNAELPGWLFRKVELFLYHTLLEVVTRIGDLGTHSISNSELCDAVRVISVMAKGADECLPLGGLQSNAATVGAKKRCSGVFLLLNACESVEDSLLNQTKSTMHRGHVILAVVMANDALLHPDRDPLERYNTFSHLYVSATPLNFIRRAGEVALEWEDDGGPSNVINAVETEMLEEVRHLQEEACWRRRNSTCGTCQDRVRRWRSVRYMPPRVLFEGEEDGGCDEHVSGESTKRKKRKVDIGEDARAPPKKLWKNEWMRKYPGVVTRGFWNEESEEAPGIELEMVLKNEVYR
jgi:hypothetical protein